jgi:alginate O-acetyltransferase complex protein AlgI
MLFTSFEFILGFLPTVLLVFFLLARMSRPAAAIGLALASLFFYAWWDQRFVLLLLGSITFNYVIGRTLAKMCERGSSAARLKMLLSFGVCADLAILGYYKYADFFLRSLNDAFGMQVPLLGLILPIGISFFTFTQIAFLVDASRGLVKEYKFTHYLLFVTYFPHLIAGPILHHKQMMPQFQKPSTYVPRAEPIAIGLALFALGLAKKLLLADPLSAYVAPAFKLANAGSVFSAPIAWTGALTYTFQLYFDFSGYSDMAVGISLLFGIRLPINFYSPYRASNIVEFWRRWHITLSTFLRDYLYIPLGGSRKGSARRYTNLMITMILGGLWHGANWTFVVWGLLHGLYLCVNHLKQHLWPAPNALNVSKPRHAVSVAITFFFVVIAWIVFRADHVSSAVIMIRSLFFWRADPVWADAFAGLAIEHLLKLLAVSAVIVWALPNAYQLLRVGEDGDFHLGQRITDFCAKRPISLAALAVAIACLMFFSILSQFGPSTPSPFLYFQF